MDIKRDVAYRRDRADTHTQVTHSQQRIGAGRGRCQVHDPCPGGAPVDASCQSSRRVDGPTNAGSPTAKRIIGASSRVQWYYLRNVDITTGAKVAVLSDR